MAREKYTQPLPEGTIVHHDIAYVTGGHERHKLDLYLPYQREATQQEAKPQLPVVVLIHGGAFRMGSKEDEDPIPLLEAGYVVAAINYRLSQHAIWPAQIEDCKAAVRWLRAHATKYHLDVEHFASYGPSAGGHLAAMLGVTGDAKQFDVGEHLEFSSRVQAVVDFYGPTDFLQMDDHRLPEGLLHNPADSPESQLIGGAIQENQDKVAHANPIRYITSSAPPFLIVHGDQDSFVPYHQSDLLAAALKAVGVPVTFHTVEGGGHGGFNDSQIPALLDNFLAQHLK